MKNQYSIGDMSEIVGLKVHQVRYVCEKHKINPVSVVGGRFAYNSKALEKLRAVIVAREAALEEKVAKK